MNDAPIRLLHMLATGLLRRRLALTDVTIPARPWQPPAAFNFIATLIAFGAAIGLAWMAWNYYEYAPWTRDGRVRVYTAQVAPKVRGTVVSLHTSDTYFVHKGDVLFQIDPRAYENRVKQATGQLAQTKANASYLDAEATRRSQLADLSVSAEQRQNGIDIARGANDAVLGGNRRPGSGEPRPGAHHHPLTHEWLGLGFDPATKAAMPLPASQR